jgi:hypothetical protein
MTFLEPIIAAVIGAGATALAVKFNKTKVSKELVKYGPFAQKAYDIIDPVLVANMKGWQGSQVEATFQVVVEAVADGTLTPVEIKTLALQLAKDWLPAKAVTKANQYVNAEAAASAPEAAAVKAVTDFINGDAANTKVFTEVRNLLKLKK